MGHHKQILERLKLRRDSDNNSSRKKKEIDKERKKTGNWKTGHTAGAVSLLGMRPLLM